jgi:hypothetical protein
MYAFDLLHAIYDSLNFPQVGFEESMANAEAKHIE